ncbi:MAG: hypothetical protein Q7L55_11645 [Actinomycetota bacterium]|nr:hypothetical protein [Actinomycetota bacterium]
MPLSSSRISDKLREELRALDEAVSIAIAGVQAPNLESTHVIPDHRS